MIHLRSRALLLGVGTAGVLAALSVWGVAAADDRASTAALLDQLEHDPAHAPLVAGNVKRARAALERATRLRAAGDEGHARLADGLAREEAETARDLARAIDAERAADDARRGAIDAGVTGERERALLEEGIARNGRLRAQIDELGKPRTEAKTSRTAASDAGAAAPAPDAPGAPAPSAPSTHSKPAPHADGGVR
jgi:hypothetical protein